MRVKITLACTECKQRNYNTTKNKKNDPDRLEMKKYCKFCRKHTLENKTGFLAKIKRYFKDMRGELKKVVWPEKKQVLNNTGIVIIVLIISACIICGFDFVITKLVSLFFMGA